MFPKWDEKAQREFNEMRNRQVYTKGEVDTLLRNQTRALLDRIAALEKREVVLKKHIVDADGTLAGVTAQFNLLLAELERLGILTQIV